MKRTTTAAALAAVLTFSGTAHAQADARGDWADFGLGVAAVAINLAYVPAKLCYAGLGGIFGALALGITAGNGNAADEIWGSTMGGDYVVTNGMLRGEERLHFVGTEFGESGAGDEPIVEEGL